MGIGATKLKNKSEGGIIRLSLLVCALSCTSPQSAIGEGFCDTTGTPGTADLGSTLRNLWCPVARRTAQMQCSDRAYTSALARSCRDKCKASVDKWMREIPKAAEAAAAADGTIAQRGIRAGAGSTTGVNAGLQAFRGQNLNATERGQAQAQRGTNAEGMKTKFEECKKDVNKSCQQKLSEDDRSVAEAVFKACDEGSKGTGEFANQKKQDGLGMGDLSKLMDAASKAMAAMPQNKEEAPSGLTGTPSAATSPTLESTKAPETQVAKLGGNSMTAPSIGFGNLPTGQQVAINAGRGDPGSGLSGASSSGREGFNSSSGSNTPGAGGGETSASSGSPGGGGGGGGGGSGGSSRAPASEALAAASDNSGYEMNGGGGKSYGSLKPSKADVDAVADGSVLGGSEAPIEEAPAAAEQGAPEDSLDDGDSIFARVKSRYETLKGSGRI